MNAKHTLSPLSYTPSPVIFSSQDLGLHKGHEVPRPFGSEGVGKVELLEG
jgi:hypothetical protein